MAHRWRLTKSSGTTDRWRLTCSCGRWRGFTETDVDAPDVGQLALGT